MDVYNGTSAVQIRRRTAWSSREPTVPTMSIYYNVAPPGLTPNGFHERKRLDEIVERSLSLSALWDEFKRHDAQEVWRQPLRRPAAAPVHRARHRGRAPGSPDGRTLLGSRSHFPGKIEELIFQLKERFTIVIVTHNMQQASRVAEFTGFFFAG